ncbi:GNAT family N-acetyltransferase [Aneurinibacillus sp. Ricciae_BoGa-3]|uniref:GNAT family N-acetyltransferase n=1 Tax=Aneurinibacillus sp. Ricciae_BoGa-3 TaxID=3022697 RepID=UPI0023420FF7|nr:GNAT family N-acetyltransferase [Aneurinibacillus sp. Ricciae_BoGa-3]WCK52354.1 GNAT family N-acetyltransferase [Aneurinibacillus sp. Ricciae_BoGa-3]
MEVLFKKLETIKELEAMASLETRVWAMKPIPLHQTFTAAKNGGIVIGAYEGQQMIGFIYSFPGFAQGEPYLCSHMMGIDSDYQNRGIGYLLKMKQAEEARKLGYDKIKWTYDPLESRNAYLNIVKLGAICSEYIENCYGEMTDGLNRGIASDRFNVEWHINSPYLHKRILFANLSIQPDAMVLGWQLRKDGYPQALIKDLAVMSQSNLPFLFVSIPSEFQKIKQVDLELAVEWRLQTRRVFREAFAGGWMVCHAIRCTNCPIQYSVLIKKEKLSFNNSKENGGI